MTTYTHVDRTLLAQLLADPDLRRHHVMAGDGFQAPGAIVLRHQANAPGKFVIHFANLQCGGFHQGWYDLDEGEALIAYRDRCHRYDPTGELHRAAEQRQAINDTIERSCAYVRSVEARREAARD